jgi:hypothetical protein
MNFQECRVPTYCFQCECGQRRECVRVIADRNRPLRCRCGKGMKRDIGTGGIPSGKRGEWPLRSYAMSVGEGQIQEAIAHDRKLGVPTNYLPDGRPEIRNASHYRKYRRAHGYRDRNGYSD